jgi:hypothetical protein
MRKEQEKKTDEVGALPMTYHLMLSFDHFLLNAAI